MHLHHAYGNNAYPVIPAEQVLPADESARFDMGITHIFKVNGNKLHRTDTGLCKLLFNQLQHDRLSAAADTGHNLDQLRSTSVRVEQRSTGPLAPLESKTTVSTCVVSVLGTHNVYLVLNYPIVQVNNSAARSAVPPALPASAPAEISAAFPG